MSTPRQNAVRCRSKNPCKRRARRREVPVAGRPCTDVFMVFGVFAALLRRLVGGSLVAGVVGLRRVVVLLIVGVVVLVRRPRPRRLPLRARQPRCPRSSSLLFFVLAEIEEMARLRYRTRVRFAISISTHRRRSCVTVPNMPPTVTTSSPFLSIEIISACLASGGAAAGSPGSRRSADEDQDRDDAWLRAHPCGSTSCGV